MCTSNLDDMHSKIDYYLDNKAKLSRYEKVKKTIVSTFYETLNYKGD